MILMVNAARRFPETAKWWSLFEMHATRVKTQLGLTTSDSSLKASCASSGLAVTALILVSAAIQTVVGTLINILMENELQDSLQGPTPTPPALHPINGSNATDVINFQKFVASSMETAANGTNGGFH